MPNAPGFENRFRMRRSGTCPLSRRPRLRIRPLLKQGEHRRQEQTQRGLAVNTTRVCIAFVFRATNRRPDALHPVVNDGLNTESPSRPIDSRSPIFLDDVCTVGVEKHDHH